MFEEEKFRDKYRIKSLRLKDWNYSSEGAYFITICTKDRECFFGNIENAEMTLNNVGKIAKEYWQEIPQHFPCVVLDEFIIMPNHVHGIIFIYHSDISTNVAVETKNLLSLQYRQQNKLCGTSRTIGSIIRGFKIGVTKWINNNTHLLNIWQKNFYDHIIRDEKSLNNIRQYIIDNSLNWENDKNKTENLYY